MDYAKHISLDPRLSAIAEMLGSCDCCADIGSDHGRLGAFLLQNHRCKRAVLTDISADSLAKARKLVALVGVEARCDFRVGDGALALDSPVDAAVIAGMGGETIAEIVENAQGRLDGARLIVQPNVAAPELRARLNAAGWRIEDEELARDGRRIYLILAAALGEQALSAREVEVGPLLLAKRHPLLGDYAAFRLRVDGKALVGARAGKDEAAAAELSRRIAIWEEVRQWLERSGTSTA